MSAPQQDNPIAQIPPHPTMERLRVALAQFDGGWEIGPESSKTTALAVAEAAQTVLDEHDAQIQAINLALSMPRPSADQIAAQLSMITGNTVTTADTTHEGPLHMSGSASDTDWSHSAMAEPDHSAVDINTLWPGVDEALGDVTGMTLINPATGQHTYMSTDDLKREQQTP